MKKYILFSIIALAALWFLGSAQPTEAATINAASCSYADVSAAISATAPEDTVNVPAGNCTWTSTLTITKGINLIGAGIGNTVITNNTTGGVGYGGHHCWSYVPSNYDLNTPFRMSGFTIDLDHKAGWLSLGKDAKRAPFTIQTKVRIDHNSIINAPNNVSAAYIWAYGDMYGVVDNNNFSGAYYGFKSDPQIVASYAWYTTPPQSTFVSGSSNYLYYEDNTISLTTGDNLLVEGQYGGRHAWRYNTITGGASYSLFEAHGHQGTGPTAMPSVFGAEIYGNRITNEYGNLFKTRGGRSFVFFNSMVNAGGYSTAYEGSLVRCPPEDYDDPVAEMIHDNYWFGSRTGYTGALTSANADHTYGLSCNGLDNIPTLGRDVISDNSSPGVTCGTLANLPGTCTKGQGYWATNQSCTNLMGMVGANPTTPISGTLYKCTSTNTWTAYYTPLTYPHPLRSDSPVQTCTYTYSAWGTCQSNNTQTRTVVSSSPSGCTGTPVLTQSCTYTPQNFLPEQYIQAESGQLSSMQTGVSGSDTYIYTPTDNTGSVSFVFNILTAGQYKMEALVNSNNDAGQNSFYVGLDNESAQGNNTYTYSLSLVSSFTWDDVNKVGNGIILPEFDPITWNLTQGTHTFTFYGRESNTWLDQIILKRVTADITPPAAPSGVRVS